MHKCYFEQIIQNLPAQEPVTIEMGSTYQYRARGAKRLLTEKPDTFQFVPLIQNLEWLLQNKDIYKEVCCLSHVFIQ